MYVLQLNIYDEFCCYLAGKSKSYSKFRKFNTLETRDLNKALKFNSKEDAIKYKNSDVTTLNYFPVEYTLGG